MNTSMKAWWVVLLLCVALLGRITIDVKAAMDSIDTRIIVAEATNDANIRVARMIVRRQMEIEGYAVEAAGRCYAQKFSVRAADWERDL